MKKLYLSGDHAGFKLKEKLKPWLEKKGFKIKDFGPLKYNKNDDYPDFVIPMARAVKNDKNSLGIIIAGSGQGESIATNKIKGIRTALYHGGKTKIVRTGRAHDNANVLSFGSRFVTENEARKAINVFLKTKFEKGRHKRRVWKVSKLGGK
ncbi:MAG: RpiB/LacA/LacB family sugar-phosphate isomerase [Nanoarchaeota archaeon]|nr:RpiB/LacA/LacB family sugar-phosphate isomerase [Nanoarchaeota archaeon]